jgi:hypothetical protein
VVGANLSTAYGGLTHSPTVKTAVTLALEAVKPTGMCNALYHGNTTVYKPLVVQNYAVLGRRRASYSP